MENWKYAILSKVAKQNGGPEKFVEKIYQAGVDKGIKIGFDRGVALAEKTMQ